MTQSQRIELSDVAFERPLEFIPAVTFNQTSARRDGAMGSLGSHTDFSLTGKLGLTSNLTLDAAYNPDFSQVEADAGQIDVNLRYSIFYSEKRPSSSRAWRTSTSPPPWSRTPWARSPTRAPSPTRCWA